MNDAKKLRDEWKRFLAEDCDGKGSLAARYWHSRLVELGWIKDEGAEEQMLASLLPPLKSRRMLRPVSEGL